MSNTNVKTRTLSSQNRQGQTSNLALRNFVINQSDLLFSNFPAGNNTYPVPLFTSNRKTRAENYPITAGLWSSLFIFIFPPFFVSDMIKHFLGKPERPSPEKEEKMD